MPGERRGRSVALLRLALGAGLALLLGGMIALVAAREPTRMRASAASFEGRAVANGAAVFKSACAGCHGVAGQGVPEVAPALNAPAFFADRLAEIGYGGDLRSYIESTITAGRPVVNEQYHSAMPAWDQRYGGALRPDEIRDVTSFILNWQTGPDGGQVRAAVGPPADDGAAAAAGKAYFGSRDCLGCHGWPGRGGITGPDLAGVAARGGEQMPGVDAQGYLRISILAPSAFIAADCPPGPCPDMMPRDYGAQLTPRELEILVRYLLTLTDPRSDTRPPGAPAPLVGGLTTPAADAETPETPLARGERLYEAHCGMCHGDRGQGGMGPALSVALVSVDPLAYARAATAQGVPGTLMPAWDESLGGPLSASELDDVAAFVVELARQLP